MEIIFSPVKGWWKKRLSQKSLVSEKRSGRPSILRKVQKKVISKSLHKRGWSTRKLASKLTIQGLQCSKDTIHRYLRFDLWSLFMQEACFTQNLQKSDCKWLQFSNEWQKWTVWWLEEYHIYRWVSSVPVSAWKSQKWRHLGQTEVKSGIHSKVQVSSKNHGLGRNDSFRCVQATCDASKPNCESKLSKRAFSFYSYLMIWTRLVILEKLKKEDLWKHVGFDIVAGRSTSLQGHRNSKSDLKPFFSVLSHRLLSAKHAWPFSHRKYVWNFQSQGGNLKTLLQEPWIASGHSGSLSGND